MKIKGFWQYECDCYVVRVQGFEDMILTRELLEALDLPTFQRYTNRPIEFLTELYHRLAPKGHSVWLEQHLKHQDIPFGWKRSGFFLTKMGPDEVLYPTQP